MDNFLQSFIPSTKIEPEALHAAFDIALSEQRHLDDLYALWRDFFADNQGNYARINGFSHHWELFVRLTWQIILRLPDAEIFSHMKWQVTTAFRLNIPVEDRFFTLLYFRFPTEKEIEAAYRSIRREILESPIPVNPGKSGSLSLRDLVKQRGGAVPRDVGLDDSVLLARIEQELFATVPIHGVSEEVDKVGITRAFLSFVDFLRKTETIADVVVDFIMARQEQALSDVPESELSTKEPLLVEDGNEGGDRQSDPIIPTNINEVSSQLPAAKTVGQEKASRSSLSPKKNTSPKMIDVVSPHISYAHIRELIEERFSKDELGQYEDIDAVLAMLGTLAAEYGDDQISELYYFDEQAERFQWNEGIISGKE